jgi:hypothetical protein
MSERTESRQASRFATREAENRALSEAGMSLATIGGTMKLLVLLACASFAAACTDTVQHLDGFVGNWSCNGSSTTTFSQPPNTPDSTASTAATVSISDDGKGNITENRNPIDAGPPCTLKRTLSADGSTLTTNAGQTCSTANGGTITYTSGSSTLNSDGTYTTNATWTLNGTTTKGLPLVGSGTGSSTCTKM